MSEESPRVRTTKPKRYLACNIYFGPQHEELLLRLKKLEHEYPNISISGMLITAIEACIGTFEKEIPKKRSFILNGCKITI